LTVENKSQVQIPSVASQVKCFFTPPPHGKGLEVKINTFTFLIFSNSLVALSQDIDSHKVHTYRVL